MAVIFWILLFVISWTPSLGFSKVIARGESEGMTYLVEEVSKDLGVPWGFAFLEPHRLILSEREGTLWALNLRNRKQQKLIGFPKVFAKGQGGLLDLRTHPKYPKVPWIYTTYSEPSEGGAGTVLARFQIRGAKVVRFQKLFVTNAVNGKSHHFGSRLTFDEKGFVYFSVGDRGERNNAQNLDNHAGSILRVFENGSVPKDNPFSKPNGEPSAIWSYGHRNPQGLYFDKAGATLWSIEHGPRGGDEINGIKKGKNYGWPIISYGKEYMLPIPVGESTHKKGMEQPAHYYVPSIAPSSLLVYRGAAFPKWNGNLFSGALKLTHLNRVALNGEKFVKEERLLSKLSRRIRNVVSTPEGHLLLSTDRGELLRVRPQTKNDKSKLKQ